ncbi:MAG: hypothetical protein LUF29_08245 [Oscillospiraceae bacterium]|nr:hypothetical protein [Oscillospiraceae bacterium]
MDNNENHNNMNNEFKNMAMTVCEQLLGQQIHTDNVSENMSFVSQSKRLAASHEWLYHCTTAEALKSILKNKEFWLSNLKCVNDRDEAERIDVPEYENSYYIASFTYDKNVTEDHWEEYGSIADGVLIAVKPKWFLRKATFMTSNNQKINSRNLSIMETKEIACSLMKNASEVNTNPFYINSFGFYQVIYDDELKKNIAGNAVIKINESEHHGISLTPEVAGIIKSTHGVCRRSGKLDYDKNWASEKEVRLKVGIQQYRTHKNGNEINDNAVLADLLLSKIAVPLAENAFDTLKIGVSPKFENKEDYLKELGDMYPDIRIELLDNG